MDWLAAPDYTIAGLLLQRAVAGIYLIAFVSAVNQFRPLLGEHGLLPVPRFLERVSFRSAPSIFHLHYSDRFFGTVAWMGAMLAAAILMGLLDPLPAAAWIVAWLLLWVVYLSIVNVGQTFYGFGWESILLEAGFLAAFLGPPRTAPPMLVIYLFRWLLFRVEFGAGLIKMRGDPCWRDLTCLHYHHETQPLPGPFSWHFHHLPAPLHRVEVAANHVTQLAMPFLLFAPQPAASIAGAAVIVTQAWLVLSGNFAWLNAITMAVAFAAFSDDVIGRLGPDLAGAVTLPPAWFGALTIALTIAVVGLSYRPVRNLTSRRQLMNFSYNPYHLVGTYGAFGSVTRIRRELVIEGTSDQRPSEISVWKEYGFKGKPGDPGRRPPQVAPYHLRLDWLMWFVPLSPIYAGAWLPALVGKLLTGDRDTLKLLGHNPFPGDPPAFIRIRRYRYRFSTTKERRASGVWWVRHLEGDYMPPTGTPPRR